MPDRISAPWLRQAAAPLVGLAVLAAAACTPAPAQPGVTPTAPGAGGASEVRAEGTAFQPATIQIRTGESVTWTNFDSVAHTVTSGQPGAQTADFDGTISTRGAEFTHTFQTAGTFEYFCRFHPTMRARVEVRDP